VGSQDTTGADDPRLRMKELACLGFSADLVLPELLPTNRRLPQAVDLKTHGRTGPISSAPRRVALRPGDGIHPQLAEPHLLLPGTTVGTGGDSHTRFPARASPSRPVSGPVAFAAAIGGHLPLDMPEWCCAVHRLAPSPASPCAMLVNAIPPYVAIQEGAAHRCPKAGQGFNVFSGRSLEIEGLGPESQAEQGV